jgi:hypothetical protein
LTSPAATRPAAGPERSEGVFRHEGAVESAETRPRRGGAVGADDEVVAAVGVDVAQGHEGAVGLARAEGVEAAERAGEGLPVVLSKTRTKEPPPVPKPVRHRAAVAVDVANGDADAAGEGAFAGQEADAFLQRA